MIQFCGLHLNSRSLESGAESVGRMTQALQIAYMEVHPLGFPKLIFFGHSGQFLFEKMALLMNLNESGDFPAWCLSECSSSN